MYNIRKREKLITNIVIKPIKYNSDYKKTCFFNISDLFTYEGKSNINNVNNVIYQKYYDRSNKKFILFNNYKELSMKFKISNIIRVHKMRRFYRYNNLSSMFINYDYIINNRALDYKNKKNLLNYKKYDIINFKDFTFLRRTLKIKYPK